MHEFLTLLESVALFDGIEPAELEAVLNCVRAAKKVVRKGRIILLAGDRPKHVGIVLAGQVHVVRDDHDGNRSLLSVLTEGDTFAEALCCAAVAESPVTVIAGLDSTVLLLSFEKIVSTCPTPCSFHRNLISNLLGLIASKNLMLQSHMEIISKKSVRAKVLRFIESFEHERGRAVSIPFSREEMANYLCVERSALSHELARMKKDGLIDYKKNRFVLK